MHIRVPDGDDSLLTVCGDVHGQFYDLLNIFETNGYPSPTHGYLFNGDYVDRGSFSMECLLTLLSFLVLYPTTFHMSRGNHETKDLNRIFGFEGECKAKYGDFVFGSISELFCFIPLAQVIENRVIVVHGGLFKRDDVTLSELAAIDRVREPPAMEGSGRNWKLTLIR